MNSDERLFPDDKPVDFFRKFAECGKDSKELMESWAKCEKDSKELMELQERIKLMDLLCLQVYVRGKEWMPMLIRFLDQWGDYCVSDDVHKCYLMVVKEKTIFSETGRGTEV